jgi:Methylamine utilisation protein MauE
MIESLIPQDPSIPIIGRVLLLLVFARALAGKLQYRDEFVGVVANFRLVPAAWAAVTAWLIIVLEAAVVVSLATGLDLMGGALLALILLSVFGIAMVINIGRGRTDIDCGCFRSALRQHLSFALVARNALLAASALPLLGVSFASKGPSLSILQLVDGVGAGAILFVLSQAVEQLQAARAAVVAMRKRYS